MIGFFAKQMVLNIALNKGYIFTSIIAIITSIISAVYYLVIVKNLFFIKSELYKNDINVNYNFIKNVYISGYYSLTISFLTLFIISYLVYDNIFIYLIFKI
jgi:NADH-ubiquinone oxidoreductase chain 2